MQPLDASARELDPGAFGTLAHDALRCLADFPDFDDEDKLAGILLARLAKRTLRQFGPTPSLAVRIQLRSLQQRLRAAACIHAAAVREGWRIAQAEESFIGEIDGMPVHARIDRIDRHTDGRIRILDYKTANTARSPRETHYRPVLQRWDDLQLPLYRHLYEQRNPGAPPPTVAYFHLPQASADAVAEQLGFERWGVKVYSGYPVSEKNFRPPARCIRSIAVSIRSSRRLTSKRSSSSILEIFSKSRLSAASSSSGTSFLNQTIDRFRLK